MLRLVRVDIQSLPFHALFNSIRPRHFSVDNAPPCTDLCFRIGAWFAFHLVGRAVGSVAKFHVHSSRCFILLTSLRFGSSRAVQLNISYPATSQQKVVEIEDERKLRALYDHRISHEIEGEALGDEFKGYVFRISGGNDKQGFAMKQGVLTASRVRLLFTKGACCFVFEYSIQPVFVLNGAGSDTVVLLKTLLVS